MLRPSMKPMTWLLLLLVSIVGTDAARIVAHTASHSHHDLLEPHDMEDSSVISVRRDTTFDQFTTELAGSMEHHRLSKRALDWVFDEDAVLMRPHPPCTGLWLEFGGALIQQARAPSAFQGNACKAQHDFLCAWLHQVYSLGVPSTRPQGTGQSTVVARRSSTALTPSPVRGPPTSPLILRSMSQPRPHSCSLSNACRPARGLGGAG